MLGPRSGEFDRRRRRARSRIYPPRLPAPVPIPPPRRAALQTTEIGTLRGISRGRLCLWVHEPCAFLALADRGWGEHRRWVMLKWPTGSGANYLDHSVRGLILPGHPVESQCRLHLRARRDRVAVLFPDQHGLAIVHIDRIPQ